MTRDEIKLVVFILSALVVGALVQHFRTRQPLPSAVPEAESRGWAKPPYVLKEKKANVSASDEAEGR